MPEEGKSDTGSRLLEVLKDIVSVLLESRTAQLSPEDRAKLDKAKEWLETFMGKKKLDEPEKEVSQVKEPEDL